MREEIRGLLAEDAARLVHESYAGVQANWWWERRITGGIAICQELDPKTMAQVISSKSGRPEPDARRAIERELGLEDSDPVTLTFEIEGDATAGEAAALLRERSTTPEGIAASLYRTVLESL